MGFLVHVAFEYRGVQGEPVDVHLAGDGDFLPSSRLEESWYLCSMTWRGREGYG